MKQSKIMHCVAFETATSSQGILWRGAFVLCFECNCDISPVLFNRGGQSVLAPFVGARAQMTHQPQVREWHCEQKRAELAGI